MLSYGKLGFTVYFAFTLSLLTAGTAFKLWIEYDARTLAVHLQAETAAAAKELRQNALMAQQERTRRQLEQNKAIEKQNAINAQKQRTCSFWRDQYMKNKTSYDKTMMDSACK